MTVDFAGVTASYDRTPPNYAPGDTIRITLAGKAVCTTDSTTVQETWGPYDIPVETANGAATISCPVSTVSRTSPGQRTNEDVFIAAAAGAALTLGGRNFTVAADRRSVSAVA